MAKTLKPLQAGQLRHVGNLQKLVKGVDAAGGPTANYCLWRRDIRFSIEDFRATEIFQAQQVGSQLTTYIQIRFRPELLGVEPNVCRLSHRLNPGKTPPCYDYYDIQGARRDVQLRYMLQLSCIRRDSAGFRTGNLQPIVFIDSTDCRINSTDVYINNGACDGC